MRPLSPQEYVVRTAKAMDSRPTTLEKDNLVNENIFSLDGQDKFNSYWHASKKFTIQNGNLLLKFLW